MNSASAYVTWQTWSERWGHWNSWSRVTNPANLPSVEGLSDSQRLSTIQKQSGALPTVETPALFGAGATSANSGPLHLLPG